MPQPIMKKYKHGELGDAYPKAPKEKLDAGIMKNIHTENFLVRVEKLLMKRLKLGQKKK